ncbi:MAG: hypothetical protein IJA73_03415, partial [Oscillospiraceae bacterium]|nr:hypothetical protein [Oscillospiraceae bacterium]
MAPPKFGAYKDFWPGLERIQNLASAPMGTEKERSDALERLMIIARRQVRRHDFTLGAFPDDLAVAARYPGIDPQGKSCEEEMELAWRMARIRAMIPLRPAEDQKKLTQLLDSLTPKTVIGGFTPAGGHLRAYDRAAKLAPTQELYDMVLAQRRALLDKTRDIPDSFVEGKVVEGDIFELHRTSHYLDVLEYYVGLRDTLPERKPYGWERQYYSPDLIASRDVPNAAPETLAVEFQRPTGHHKMQLRCDPNNWEKDIENVPPDDFDPNDPEGNRWLTRAYFRDTLGRTLDPIFAKAETLGRGEGKGFGPINRGDLIIIDGKTVREIMVERFQELERPAEEFAAYYEKHLDAAANELVGAAMMAGSEVEIFMPTASGRASDTPTRLTPTGFAPTKKEPVALSSFEKFMNRFGFFKEKAARVAQQEQEAAARRRAMEDARKRVLERNDLQYHMAKGIAANALAPAAPLPEVITSAERAAAIERFAQSEKELNFTGRTMKDAFFSSWLAEHEELPKGPAPGVETSLSYSFSSERSGLTSMAAMEMVRRGYTIEQVLDLTQLQDERRAIGEEVARRVHEGDVDWLAELFVQGTEAVNDEVSRLYAGMDLLDETRMVASSKFLPLYGACNVLFDVGQEFDRTKFNRAGGPMEAVVKRLMPDGLSDRTGGAMGYLDRSFHRHAGLQMYMRFSGSSLMQAANMAHGERVNLAETLAFPLTLKCTRGEIADARAYDPLAAP